ncbi:hypothetical protein BH11MYX1_BH11MYX1_47960 [soil metagenome]
MTMFPDRSDHVSTIRRSPLVFFVLAFSFAIPFWLIGAAIGSELLPGLPVAALMAVCPALAALVLAHRERGAAGMRSVVERAFDWNRITARGWYAPILLLMPFVSIVAFAVIRAMGTRVPAPEISVPHTVILCGVFFIAALGEELGWSGYALEPMQQRWGALGASLVLGVLCAVYHYVALAQAHRSVAWIGWWSLGTVATRVVMVWIFNNTGRSVFAVALFHMTLNVSWQLFPVDGSYFDPRIHGPIMAVVATIVTVVWGPRTLRARTSEGVRCDRAR